MTLLTPFSNVSGNLESFEPMYRIFFCGDPICVLDTTWCTASIAGPTDDFDISDPRRARRDMGLQHDQV